MIKALIFIGIIGATHLYLAKREKEVMEYEERDGK